MRLKILAVLLFLLLVFLSGTYYYAKVYKPEPVVVEEYIAKQILEGKLGTNPGEFATVFIGNPEEGDRGWYLPKSVQLNSKGEIYVLDMYNNRIQKFDPQGKYLKSIKVRSSLDRKGNSVMLGNHINAGISKGVNDSYYRGIDIFIDSEDNLYYEYRIGEKREILLYKKDDYMKGDGGNMYNLTEGKHYSLQEYHNKRKKITNKYLLEVITVLPLWGKKFYLLGNKEFRIFFVMTDKEYERNTLIFVENNHVRFYSWNRNDRYYEIDQFNFCGIQNKIVIQPNGPMVLHFDNDDNPVYGDLELEKGVLKYFKYELK